MLSEYEQAQFKSLTENFVVEDETVLKQMEKNDKATAMSFVALPRLHTVLIVVAIIALVFCIAGRVTGNDSQMFLSGGIGLLTILISSLVPFEKQPSE